MEISSIANGPSSYDRGMAAYDRGHYEVAMYDFEPRAMNGDFIAQFYLGFMHEHGRGVPHNREKAIAWYTKAAEQGYAPAQNDLGVMYVRFWEEPVLSGKKSVITPFERALKWFNKAAQQDNPTAQFNLATVSAHLARRFPEDSKESIELHKRVVIWHKKAAEQNYAPAQFYLGLIYQEGLPVVAPSPEKTVELYIKAASPNSEATIPYKQGYAPAQHQLAEMYSKGEEVRQDIEEAIKWYKRAAEQGFVLSQYSLGLLYDMGNGVNQDFKEAKKWYQKAAEQGFARAQNNLAQMYETGGDSEKAWRLVFEAAQQGYALAQFGLGKAFEEGVIGAPQDSVEAYYWYSLASKDKSSLGEAETDNLVSDVAARRETVGSTLTQKKRNEIQKQVDNWQPKDLVCSGTGFYINKTHILTNAHVIRHPDESGRHVYKFDEVRINFRYVEEKLDSVDPEVDLALLVDQRGNAGTAATFRSYPVNFGEDIAVFGYPLSNVLSYRGNGTSGIVSGLTSIVGESQPDNLFQHTAPTQRGNSGGPVLDSAGNVVGVVVSGLNPSLISDNGEIKIADVQNVNFAIKFSVIEDFLEKSKITDYEDPISVLAKDIDRKAIYIKAEKFTVPVLCFMNKGVRPLPLEEIGIGGVKR